jgi:hypothetical protein
MTLPVLPRRQSRWARRARARCQWPGPGPGSALRLMSDHDGHGDLACDVTRSSDRPGSITVRAYREGSLPGRASYK